MLLAGDLSWEVLPLPDPKLVVLDYWGIFAYFSPPTISLFPQFLISGANACSWWDRLLDNYSAFWHLDHRRHAIVTHWFRLRISVGPVRIHHSEGKSGSEHLRRENPDLSIWWIQVFACSSSPVLLPCCRHLDPFTPPPSLSTAMGKHTKVLPPFFAPPNPKTGLPVDILSIVGLWGA